MRNTLSLTIAIWLFSALLLFSCKKSEIENLQPALSSQKISKSVDTTYRGLYVGSFNTILGTVEEDSLINWSIRNRFNALSLYSLSSILSNPSSSSRLPSFIRKAKTKNLRVVGICGSSSSFQSIHNYNLSRIDTNERFDGYNLELEWWNGASSFSNYSSILRGMRIAADQTYPKPSIEVYIGWFGSGQEASQADTLVKYCDRILIHCYRAVPSFNYTKTRLEYIGSRSYIRNKKIPVVVIFSSEKISFGASNDFMGNYYWISGLNRTFPYSYLEYHQLYLSYFRSPPTIPTSLPKYWYSISGYQVFQYRFARIARPI